MLKTTFNFLMIMVLLFVPLCLSSQNSSTPAPVDGPSITLTTQLIPKQSIISLRVNSNVKNAWIDLNGDKQCQDFEKFKGYLQQEPLSDDFVVINQDIVIYGDLTEFYCSSMNISMLDVSKVPNLEILDCSDNLLSGINISNNINLKTLNCSFNVLGKIDLSKNTKIESIDASKCNIALIDLNNCPELKYLAISWNKISKIDISKHTKLEELYMLDNELTSLDVSNNLLLTTLSCTSNRLGTIDVSKNKKLQKLYCDFNQLQYLDITNNRELIELDCAKNMLSSLDIKNNIYLKELVISNNEITNIQLAEKYDSLIRFFLHSNQLKGSHLDDIIKTMPTLNISEDDAEYGDGFFVVVDLTNNMEKNVCTVKQVADLKLKKWIAYNYNGDWDNMEPYAGSTPTNINNIHTDNQSIQIFPNPTTDIINISYDRQMLGHTAKIYNIKGECLMNFILTNTEQKVNVAHLTSGMYVIVVNGKYYTKFEKY